MSDGPVSPLTLERYELKYLVPVAKIEPMSSYLDNFCKLDYYSQISHDKFYTINSLYFDSPQLYLLRTRDSDGNHFSMRVRSYGDQPKAPYFFETKERLADYSKKRRGLFPLENWQDVFLNPTNITGFDWMKNAHIQYFLRQTKNYNAMPVILTQYRRKAYMSYFDDYARVTFDRSLRRTDETNYNVIPDDSKMLGYDDPETFDYSGGNIIVEIKCERKIPMWIVDMIRRFNLQRISFSKYSNGMLSLHSTPREAEFSGSRIPFNHPPF